jgi:hypothetical protein
MDEHLSFGQALAVVAVPAIIAAMAAVWSAVLTRRNREEVRANAERLDTGNGRSIGETVHDMAQTVEIQSALQHTNTRELLDVAGMTVRSSERLRELDVLLAEHIADSQAVHDELRRYLAGQQAKEDEDGGSR